MSAAEVQVAVPPCWSSTGIGPPLLAHRWNQSDAASPARSQASRVTVDRSHPTAPMTVDLPAIEPTLHAQPQSP